MAIIINCPSCERKLRVPDELLGKNVKCPSCQTLFVGKSQPSQPVPAAATASPPAADRTADAPPNPPPPATAAPTMNLSLDDEPAPGPRPLRTPASGASEPRGPRSAPPPPSEPAGEFRDCPYCGEQVRREAIRCRYCGEDINERQSPDDEDEDRPWERRYGPRVRRDCEPHRGNMVLVFGIISLAALVLGGCGAVVGLPFGIIAWVMGRGDMQKMDAGVMDPQGRGTTQAGKVCGIIGTVIDGALVLLCVGYIAFIAILAATGNMK
jgi:predicted Zn finger-like uncharacterized protein